MFAAPRRRLDRKPIIIALDQDNFYCGVERVLDPSLRGKPVGITQKSLLATTSYEARARGVTKLMSIKKAKELVPEMILVDGEDLTNYRRFSRGVVRLVGAVVGVKEGGDRAVEKLGLDEVFIDATNLVYDHLEQISTSWQSSTSIFFPLPSTAQELTPERSPPGFAYNPSSLPGHVLAPASRAIAPGPSSPDVDAQALIIGGHLAAFIRKKIKEIMGLTSSAGIARNKLLAKLVAGVKKPDAQTTFLAEPVWHGHEADGEAEGDMVQKFLDSMEVRKLNGFGSKTVASLIDDLGARSIVFEAPLTVHRVRSLFVRSDFIRLFKDRPKLGPRLWGLLHGIDEEMVRPNPEYPKQISVEDSYARTMKRSLGKIRGQMQALVEDLLDRLEDELMDDATVEGIWRPLENGSRAKVEATSRRTWKRYPRQFRLALRLDWDHPGGRDLKSIVMPAFVFDTQRTVADRAEALMSKIGSGLLKELLGLKKGDKSEDTDEFAVYVINVAAVNLSSERPPPSLVHGWSSGPAAPDQDFLDSLPSDIKREVLARYAKPGDSVKRKAPLIARPSSDKRQKSMGPGFSATQAIDIDDEFEIIEIDSSPETKPSKQLRTTILSTAENNARAQSPTESLHDDNDKESPDGADTTCDFDTEPSIVEEEMAVSSQTICKKCGTTVYNFSREAHARWHESDDS